MFCLASGIQTWRAVNSFFWFQRLKIPRALSTKNLVVVSWGETQLQNDLFFEGCWWFRKINAGMSFVFSALKAWQPQKLIKCVTRNAMTLIIYHCCLALGLISRGKEAHNRACLWERVCRLLDVMLWHKGFQLCICLPLLFIFSFWLNEGAVCWPCGKSDVT